MPHSLSKPKDEGFVHLEKAPVRAGKRGSSMSSAAPGYIVFRLDRPPGSAYWWHPDRRGGPMTRLRSDMTPLSAKAPGPPPRAFGSGA